MLLSASEILKNRFVDASAATKLARKLEDLYQKYNKLGFTILGINVEEDATKANQIIAKGGISFPILYDNQNSVSKLYNVSAMPSTVIIDRNGNQRAVHLGYKPGYEDLYASEIKKLVRE